jgi:single-strand DNA-binding protein
MEKEVGFFDVETWGKLANACANHGRKGRGVRVVGRLKQDRWTGSDGKSHNRIAIVAEHVEYRPDFKKTASAESNAGIAADTITAEMLAESALVDAVSEYENEYGIDESQIDNQLEELRAAELQAVGF